MPAFKNHTADIVNNSWNGPSNKTKVRKGESQSYYGKIYAWYDPDKDEGNKTTYRFIHHEVDANGDPGAANTRGCLAGIEVINGARGGTTIPSGDKRGVYDHLAKHMRDAGEDVPEYKGKVTNMERGFEIKAKANTKEAEIYIYDEIGSDWWGGVSAKQIKNELQALGDLEKISVHIHSPGGDVFDGMTIHNLLKQNAAKIVVYIDGSAFSAASFIAMAGDEIHMAENSMMMIHEPWTIAMGFAADMRDVADRLEKVTEMMVNTYSKRTGKDEGEIADLLAAETWMTPEEAVEMGFADSIIEPVKMAAHFDLEKYKYRHNPMAVEAKVENKEPEAVAMPAEEEGEPMPPDTPKVSLESLRQSIEACDEILMRDHKD